jgi:hypothetical protein
VPTEPFDSAGFSEEWDAANPEGTHNYKGVVRKFAKRRAKRRSKRKHKKEQSREQQQAAEANIASNVATAQELYNRDLTSQADPATIAAQRSALERLGQISNEGFTALDRQALDQAQMQASQYEQSQRGAALDAAARRGDASGGNALMASLAAQQGGANRASQYATDIGLEGRQRALSALGQQGQLAGQMRGQDDAFQQWATGQRSSDAGMLMNARLGQAQYQMDRSEALKPQSLNPLDIFNQGLQSFGQAAGAFGGGGGGGGGSDAGQYGGGNSFGGGEQKSMATRTQAGTPAAEQEEAAKRYAAARGGV